MTDNSYYKRQQPFAILVLLLLTIFFLDRSVQHGLFLDGLIYASVARNMANGEGSFWIPYYAGPSPFFSHPPLMFGLQAIFFKIFGSFYGTEKIYSFCVWLVTLLLIKNSWKQIDTFDRFRAFYWLPLLCWGFMPSVLWAYPNNILDSTMAVFDLAAVLCLYKGLQKGKMHIDLVLAALFIFCASFTKGLSGLFPLTIPVVYALVYRTGKVMPALLQSLFMLVIIAAIYFVLWQFPQPHEYLNNYFNWQIVGSLSGRNDVTESAFGRLNVLQMLLTEMVIVMGIGLLAYVLSRILKTGKADLPYSRKHLLFFLLAGFCASLPLMISIKVRSFYLVPALPYFAIAGGIFIYPYLVPLTEKYTLSLRFSKALTIVFTAVAVLAAFLMCFKAGTIGRDEEILADINTISQNIPAREKVLAAPGLDYNYEFMAYLQRYKTIDSYYPFDLNEARYIIADGHVSSACYLWRADLNGYRRLPLATRRFIVYRKQ